MTRMLNLAAVATVAVTAIFGIASASAAKFHTNIAGVELAGLQEGTHKMEMGGNSFTCASATFSGKAEGTENGNKTGESQKLHPAYSGCTLFGFINQVVDTTGCTYAYSANSEEMTLAGCTNGGITFHASAFFGTTTCHVIVQNQTGINRNKIPSGKSTDISMTVEISSNNIHYEVLTDKGVCPFEKAGQTGTNATYTGTTKVTAAGGANIWKE